MTSRRAFLSGLVAAGIAPVPGWADAGAPDFLAAGQAVDGSYTLCGLYDTGTIAFRIPLPDRGHAAAAHPIRPEAVAFARRPGTFALVIDCRTGRVPIRLNAPAERHFYGHGAFSADGHLLFTTENAYEEGQGRIGVWDAAEGYRRVGEFASGGVGPHEILRLPGTDTLVVANGGIDTHPDSGRAKLNIPVMEPSLAYLSADGVILEQYSLRADWHMNSIRHLAARADGMVAAAMQWQGDITAAPPLVMTHRMGETPRFLARDGDDHRQMQGYAGSVAFTGDGTQVAISSPRGGLVQMFDADTGASTAQIAARDVCGLAVAEDGVFVTAGTGQLSQLSTPDTVTDLTRHGLAWDNHVVPIASAATRQPLLPNRT